MDLNDTRRERRRNEMPGAHDPILQSLEAYWNTLRHTTRIPARNDIEPSKIDHVLPHAFILQRVAPGTARMRVAGQRLHDLLKMDARGMPLTTLFQPESRDQIKELLESAFMQPAVIAVPLHSPGSLIRPEIRGAMLLLPLSDHLGQSNRLLGALVTDTDQTNRPRRFVIPEGASIRHERLGLQLAAETLMPRAPAQAKGPQAASAPALKLVVNNA
ncbi:MAG: PAS domain-containing protein [Pseudomonadota bacterium]